jgi:hypothetical protein
MPGAGGGVFGQFSIGKKPTDPGFYTANLTDPGGGVVSLGDGNCK